MESKWVREENKVESCFWLVIVLFRMIFKERKDAFLGEKPESNFDLFYEKYDHFCFSGIASALTSNSVTQSTILERSIDQLSHDSFARGHNSHKDNKSRGQ